MHKIEQKLAVIFVGAIHAELYFEGTDLSAEQRRLAGHDYEFIGCIRSCDHELLLQDAQSPISTT
jgi:hypothetical protein